MEINTIYGKGNFISIERDNEKEVKLWKVLFEDVPSELLDRNDNGCVLLYENEIYIN